MIVYYMEILDSKFLFFSTLTKLQECMFKKIHWILIAPDGPTKILYNRCQCLEVHCALIEYENGKVNPAYYLIQIIGYDEAYDQ